MSIAPCAAQTAATGRLPIGDEPVPVADIVLPSKTFQQIGICRAGLLDLFNWRYQNSTDAALAEATPSTGMNK